MVENLPAAAGRALPVPALQMGMRGISLNLKVSDVVPLTCIQEAVIARRAKRTFGTPFGSFLLEYQKHVRNSSGPEYR